MSKIGYCTCACLLVNTCHYFRDSRTKCRACIQATDRENNLLYLIANSSHERQLDQLICSNLGRMGFFTFSNQIFFRSEGFCRSKRLTEDESELKDAKWNWSLVTQRHGDISFAVIIFHCNFLFHGLWVAIVVEVRWASLSMCLVSWRCSTCFWFAAWLSPLLLLVFTIYFVKLPLESICGSLLIFEKKKKLKIFFLLCLNQALCTFRVCSAV